MVLNRDRFENIDTAIEKINSTLLKPELFKSFRELTVKDFISTVALATHEPGKTASPITCKNDSTLGSVIDTLASKAVHRIYVVAGEDNEALGVVTLRDVISCFITEPPDFFDHYFGFDAKEILSK